MVIFDEAHNIEDAARSAASINVCRKSLILVVIQLELLSRGGTVAFKALYVLFNALMAWFERMSSVLGPEEYKNAMNVWSGEEILEIYKDELGLTAETLAVYIEHFKTVLKDNEDIAKLLNPEAEDDDGTRDNNSQIIPAYEEEGKMSAATAFLIKNLFKVLQYMFEGDNVSCFKIVIEQEKISSSRTRGPRDHELNIWCLDSSVVFKEVLTYSLPFHFFCSYFLPYSSAKPLILYSLQAVHLVH